MPSVDNIADKISSLSQKLYAQGELINPHPDGQLKQHIQLSLDNGVYLVDDDYVYCAHPSPSKRDDVQFQVDPQNRWHAIVLAQRSGLAFRAALQCVRAAQRTEGMRVLIDAWPDITISLTGVGFYPLRMLYSCQVKDIAVSLNPAVEVLSYTTDYAEEVTELYLELLTSEYGWVPHISLSDVRAMKRTFLKQSLEEMLNSGDHYLDVAFLDGQPAGFIFLSIEHHGEEITRPPEFSEINFLVVTKKQRQKGVGQSLIAKTIDRIYQLSAPELVLVTTV
ncbi:MAG: GNAT family N-acetyltransferase, partial [Candidatus Hodarchaeota archaeon]